MTGKMPGRVGDTPLVGCGGYCDDSIGACSATGHGETIARVCLCRHITGLMDNGLDPKTATEQALMYMKTRTGGTGGAITISNKGKVGIFFTSKRMAWAYAVKNEMHYGIEQNDDHVSFD
jgi:beta-aspartyl-peptidase (threonine type)